MNRHNSWIVIQGPCVSTHSIRGIEVQRVVLLLSFVYQYYIRSLELSSGERGTLSCKKHREQQKRKRNGGYLAEGQTEHRRPG